jgi:hypothetical protein
MRELFDKQQITEVLYRYCRGIDRNDIELALDVFHPDAIDNHTGTDIPIAEVARRLRNPARGVLKAVTHTLSNILIELDGDAAHSEAYFLASHRLVHQGEDLDWIVAGRYLDRFERRGEVWKISHRRAVFDWDRLQKVGSPPPGVDIARSIEGALRGRTDRSDPSYEPAPGQTA